MPFAKGVSGCPGGRTDPRKTRARIAIAKVVDDNAERIAGWFDAIERDEGPKAALQAFIALAEYALPKLARTEIAGDAEAPLHLLTDSELEAQLLANAERLGIKIDLSALH